MTKTTERPTVYLSNWASHKTPGHHGPGRLLSIMVSTPHWATPIGKVGIAAPKADDFWALQEGKITAEEYRERYAKGVLLFAKVLVPGKLGFVSKEEHESSEVKDGDTLCCVCSRHNAKDGNCHRVWLAPLLVEAGWRVILDGEKLEA